MTAVLHCHEIVKATGGTLIQGDMERVFRGVSTDSREAMTDALFIPLAGERFDGHDFLLAAVRNGAVGLLTEEGKSWRGERTPADIVEIRVSDTLRALGDIARCWRRKFSIPVIAITGSSGKTTTKEMVAAIAGITMKVLKTQGTRNNLVGLPQTLLELDEGHEIAVVEMGTNSPGEIRRLAAIAEPDVGLITNVGPAHLEGLGSLPAVQEEKGDLFHSLKETGVAIINLDDKAVRVLGGRWPWRKVTYGIRNPADIRAESIGKAGEKGTPFVLRAEEQSQEITIQAAGEHNVANALAAAAVAWALRFDLRVICQGLSSFRPVAGRMEIHRLANDAFLIDDTYNANPASVRAAIETLRELREDGESTVILGDMMELGPEAEGMHAEIGALLASAGVENVFLRGQYADATSAGARKAGIRQERIFRFEDAREILPYLLSNLKRNDWVLVKGSRKAKMEEITGLILEAFGPARGSVPSP